MYDVPAVIRNLAGERIDYTYHAGAEVGGPVVVIGHGVTGHKDRPFLVALAEGLAEAGIAALRISFSGNASSEGSFADSNISKEVEDLGAVLDALPGRPIAYAGHSMGGAVGLLRASRDPRIRVLVSLAAITHTQAFAERTFGDLTPGVGLMLGKPGCVLSQAYLDDMRRIGSVVQHAEEIAVPWLFVHGGRDALVPIQDTRDAYARARTPKQLVVLDEADHVFEPGLTPRMVDAAVQWCARGLGGDAFL
jgi:pimeloyl-ACP methyl ester carboxylesterase